MAAFTSVKSGDWSDGATWGNTSPGVKGTDWPGAASDTFTIADGHLVKYNVSETNELGASTVNGVLYFPLNANTKLTFAHVDLTIGATGKLISSSDGTVGNIGVVDKANTCAVIWNTTSDNAKGLVITNGAYVDVRGDSTLYGGTHTTTLASNWSSGQTLTATGTAPLSWVAGQTFTIARNTGNGVATTLRYTIAGVAANGGNTDITISEAAPGISFVAGGQIFNEARNVRLYKLGAETPAMDTAYTNRPLIADNHVTGTVKWTDVQFTGFYDYDNASLCTGGTYTFTNCIFRNQVYGLYRIKTATLSGCSAYSNSYGFHTATSCTYTSCSAYSNSNYGFHAATSCTYTSCSAYSNSSGFYTATSCTYTSCSAYSNSYGFHIATSCTYTSCSAYSNSYGFNKCYGEYRNGSIGWNGVVSAANTSDFYLPCEMRLINTKVPQAGFVFTDRNDTDVGMDCVIICDEYNQSPSAWRAYYAYGTITKTASPANFESAYCQKVEPLSNCVTYPMYFLGGEAQYRSLGTPFYLPASATQVKIKVQTSAFTVVPTNAELYFEVRYYDTATSTLTTATSTTVVAANDTTKEFVIAVTPNRAEKAFIRGVLKKYEAGGYVLADMIPVCV